MASSDLTSLYKNYPAVFWIEDQDTKAYLSQIWLGARFGYLIGGKESNIHAVVESAYREGVKHVFGIVDRDFNSSNDGTWTLPQEALRTYRLPVHELENLLLDADALAGCKLNIKHRPASEFAAGMRKIATDLVWWMAAKKALVEVSRSATEGYPKEPGRATVKDLDTAATYILKSTWFTSTAQANPGLANEQSMRARLVANQEQYAKDIVNGNWIFEYSGKEIFRTLQSMVYPGGKGPAGRLDLVQAVAVWQRDNDRVPATITSLRASVQGRLGIP